MKKSEMFRVYPTEYVPGFCDSYCRTERSAEWTRLRNEIATGVEWKISRPSVLY